MIDSAAGGLGGCPYAPGATGNVATEDVVYMLEGMGIATGVDMAKLVAATNAMSGLLGRPPVSRVAAALECAGSGRYRTSVTALAGPITRSGSPVEIPGTKHSSSTASIISSTNGSVPQITSRSGMSGATLRMTKMLRPTGGWISPISITMVMTTPNQMRSKPAARSGGRMIGAVIRMIDTGGRKKPSTTTMQQDRGEQLPARQLHGDDRLRGRLRDVQIAHHVGIEQRHADDHHQHGRFADASTSGSAPGRSAARRCRSAAISTSASRPPRPAVSDGVA